jgi:hypothetical protein
MVVFYPTREAIKFLPQLSQETQNGNEWMRLKENLLHRLQQTTENGYSKAVADMLNQISEIKSPLAYCTEMIGVLLLNLAQAKEKAGQIFPYKTLTNLTAEGQVGLGTLAGFSLSSLASSLGDDPSLRDKLMENTREFQAKLTDLSEDSVKRLNLFLKDALKLFGQSLET